MSKSLHDKYLNSLLFMVGSALGTALTPVVDPDSTILFSSGLTVFFAGRAMAFRSAAQQVAKSSAA